MQYWEVNLNFACAWNDDNVFSSSIYFEIYFDWLFPFSQSQSVIEFCFDQQTQQRPLFWYQHHPSFALLWCTHEYVSFLCVFATCAEIDTLWQNFIGDMRQPPLTLHAFVSCYDCLHMVNKELETQPSNV